MYIVEDHIYSIIFSRFVIVVVVVVAAAAAVAVSYEIVL